MSDTATYLEVPSCYGQNGPFAECIQFCVWRQVCKDKIGTLLRFKKEDVKSLLGAQP
ncbi:hypothetical protein [Candidatus Bathycorpusculum sp.]|uniref:hypothetical protein n=1 Tax=Candidatus Bathycorpusculum sp. TaxID=2994959 RepID=UPI0028370658|nr:hypothetical protein [Candidatus Termitimicrobium sp.]MCL2685932.1 hypothetical protein [Candidatus Termitimicrobium sp.]